ncbi:hypothetical protein [Microbispora sp. NPDC049125]|uniref:hypothetical protein n=1 Tax=Microbispora sp. NPDC049125 TaxID=3154929 RepID=UPI0034651A00
MRQSSAIVGLAMAGLVLAASTPAHAATFTLTATVNPGAEIFLTPELAPTAIYKGNVLVKLDQNPGPVEIKIGNCKGQYLGTVPIAAGDHAAYVAAAVGAPPACIRYRVRNPGTTPVTISGFGYY